MDLDETECLHCRDPLNSHNPLEIIGCMKFYALDTHTTGLREGLRQAAAIVREVQRRAAIKSDTMDIEGLEIIARDFEQRAADAAPTEVTRG